ncbi:hypothetical protein ACIP1G_06670 [Pseudomonas sp. NPDC089392]|uniref:hypothetical protein n=1 Tax=Pseudomonas sp. NPDC089392 TaxID=3364459 RepID=UPI00380AD8AF
MVTTPSPIFKMKPADLVQHPTGGIVFGVIPPISAMKLNLAEGKVYVKVGQHFKGKGGQASGHGILHIWHGKKVFLRKRGINSPDHLAAFIASLMALGTGIYHDANHPLAAKRRITLLRTIDGTLTLEPREGDRVLGFHYSVVTWTPQPTPRGTKVGEIMIDWAKEKATLAGSPSDVTEAVVAAIL